MQESMGIGHNDEVRRWLHCLTQLFNVYSKLSIDGDLEQRMKQIESRLPADVAHNGVVEITMNEGVDHEPGNHQSTP